MFPNIELSNEPLISFANLGRRNTLLLDNSPLARPSK